MELDQLKKQKVKMTANNDVENSGWQGFLTALKGLEVSWGLQPFSGGSMVASCAPYALQFDQIQLQMQKTVFSLSLMLTISLTRNDPTLSLTKIHPKPTTINTYGMLALICNCHNCAGSSSTDPKASQTVFCQKPSSRRETDVATATVRHV